MNSKSTTSSAVNIMVCVVIAAAVMTVLTGEVMQWIPVLLAIGVGAMAMRATTRGNRRR